MTTTNVCVNGDRICELQDIENSIRSQIAGQKTSYDSYDEKAQTSPNLGFFKNFVQQSRRPQGHKQKPKPQGLALTDAMR